MKINSLKTWVSNSDENIKEVEISHAFWILMSSFPFFSWASKIRKPSDLPIAVWFELKILEWDILNHDYLIWVSNGHTFDFLFNSLFLDTPTV